MPGADRSPPLLPRRTPPPFLSSSSRHHRFVFPCRRCRMPIAATRRSPPHLKHRCYRTPVATSPNAGRPAPTHRPAAVTPESAPRLVRPPTTSCDPPPCPPEVSSLGFLSPSAVVWAWRGHMAGRGEDDGAVPWLARGYGVSRPGMGGWPTRDVVQFFLFFCRFAMLYIDVCTVFCKKKKNM